MASSASKQEPQNTISEKSHNHVSRRIAGATFTAFPPSYVLVGLYRFCTEKALYKPAWESCRYAIMRGAIAGVVWFGLTFGVQRKLIKMFLIKTSTVTGLSYDTLFGYKLPFNIHTYLALVLVGIQATYILKHFISQNIRIARDLVWTQTISESFQGQGQGQGTTTPNDIWQPYTEEWDHPPNVGNRLGRLAKSSMVNMVWRWGVTTALLPFHLFPFVGMVVSAWSLALGTAETLHRPYFEAKKMTPSQVAVFVSERKWYYRSFGFTAALLEGIPIVGLAFSVSNRVGAALWALDLEKRQRNVGEKRKVQ